MNEVYDTGHSSPFAPPVTAPQVAAPTQAGVLSANGSQPGEVDTNTEPPGIVTAAAGKGSSEAAFATVLEHDTTPPEDLATYVFPYDSGLTTPEEHAQDRELRQWLADAQIPADAGGSIAAAVDGYVRRTAAFTPEQHAIEGKLAEGMLRRSWGDRTEEMLALARGLVAELDAKHGGRVVEFLESTGAGNDPRLIMQLAHHAERLAARKAHR